MFPVNQSDLWMLPFWSDVRGIKGPPKILDLHSSFGVTEYNSINFTSWTSATCLTFPFARARKAFDVTAATDGNIVPVILEYPEPSTAPLYSLERESTGVARCAWRRQGWIKSAHVRDLMARARANVMGTIPNLEKMAAFLKSFVWCPVYGEKVEPHWKR